jgi:hypothetical protein
VEKIIKKEKCNEVYDVIKRLMRNIKKNIIKIEYIDML